MDTVIYDLAYPDSHVCETRRTVDLCLKGSSPFDSKSSLCYWNSDNGVCYLVEPKDSTELLIYLAILSIVCSTPISCLCCLLLTNVIGAPVSDSSKSSQSSQIIAQVVPILDTDDERVVVSSRNEVNAIDNDRFTDLVPVIKLNNGKFHEPLQIEATRLLREIDLFRANITSEEELKLFEDMWYVL